MLVLDDIFWYRFLEIWTKVNNFLRFSNPRLLKKKVLTKICAPPPCPSIPTALNWVCQGDWRDWWFSLLIALDQQGHSRPFYKENRLLKSWQSWQNWSIHIKYQDKSRIKRKFQPTRTLLKGSFFQKRKIFQKPILSLKFKIHAVNNLFKFQAQDSFL